MLHFSPIWSVWSSLAFSCLFCPATLYSSFKAQSRSHDKQQTLPNNLSLFVYHQYLSTMSFRQLLPCIMNSHVCISVLYPQLDFKYISRMTRPDSPSFLKAGRAEWLRTGTLESESLCSHPSSKEATLRSQSSLHLNTVESYNTGLVFFASVSPRIPSCYSPCSRLVW